MSLNVAFTTWTDILIISLFYIITTNLIYHFRIIITRNTYFKHKVYKVEKYSNYDLFYSF